MNVLVTGAKGFLGSNLCKMLYQLKSQNIVDNIFEVDLTTSQDLLEQYCKNANFVFNLAGRNRGNTFQEFYDGNVLPLKNVLDYLQKYNNNCPIVLSSSIYASQNRTRNIEYGKSKEIAENLLKEYANKNNVKVYIYRFNNIFGKWGKPNLNSVVTTFCYNISRDLPVKIDDENAKIDFIYVDDVVNKLIATLQNQIEYKQDYYSIDDVYSITVGELAKLIYKFNDYIKKLYVPNYRHNTFEWKLFSTFVHYLPKDRFQTEMAQFGDDRGSSTELLKSETCGQISINCVKPQIEKGGHYHNSKIEYFIVVKGKAQVELINVLTNEKTTTIVTGEKIEMFIIPSGYAHFIKNISADDDLVFIIWANEVYNPNSPDSIVWERKNEI